MANKNCVQKDFHIMSWQLFSPKHFFFISYTYKRHSSAPVITHSDIKEKKLEVDTCSKAQQTPPLYSIMK